MPGTFMLSLSMGMTISPKIELFTQLVCRGVSAGDRGAVVVPPSSDNMTLATSWELRSTRASEDADATDGVASFVQQSMSTAGNLETWEDAAVDDTWAKQCRKNPEVQKGVASLVRPPSRLRDSARPLISWIFFPAFRGWPSPCSWESFRH